MYLKISRQGLTGARELRKRVRPFRAASFQHRPSGVLELPQAGSPLTGGKFSAEPQRGDSPSAEGGNVAAPAAGAKRKGHLRFPFLFGLLPFPCFLIRRRFPICDRFEMRNGRGFFLPCLSQPVRSVRYRSATQVGYFQQARHNSVAQLFSALYRTAPADLGVWHNLSSQVLSITTR